MNFERYKDPKESIGVGIQEYLIQRISEHVDTYLTKRMRLSLFDKLSDTIAEWVMEGGAYIKLMRTRSDMSFTEDSKYPDFYITYDSGVMHYGNCPIEEFLKKPGE